MTVVRFSRLVVLSALISVVAATLSAAEGTRVTGVLKQPSGLRVQDAEVLLIQGGSWLIVTTGPAGTFRDVKPGPGELLIRHSFSPEQRMAIKVSESELDVGTVVLIVNPVITDPAPPFAPTPRDVRDQLLADLLARLPSSRPAINPTLLWPPDALKISTPPNTRRVRSNK